MKAIPARFIAALAPLSADEDPSRPIERLLALVRAACHAEVALVIVRLDAVTAAVLASVPGEVFPDGLTTPALFAGALDSGQSTYYTAAAAPPGLPRAARGSTAIIPWSAGPPTATATTPSGALVVIRRPGSEFSVTQRELLTALSPLFCTLVRLHEAALRAEERRVRFDAIVQTLPHGLVFTDDTGAETWLNSAAATLLTVPEGSVAPYLVAEAMAALRTRADNHADFFKTLLHSKINLPTALPTVPPIAMCQSIRDRPG